MTAAKNAAFTMIRTYFTPGVMTGILGASDSGFRTAMQNRGVIMPLINALSGGQLRIERRTER